MTATAEPLRPVSGEPDAVVAVGAETATYADLLRHVHGVACALPDGTREVVVLAEDRYWFAVALLGAWEARASVALPPNRNADTVRSLTQGQVVLHDGAHPEGFDLRQWAHAGTSGGSGLGPISPDRHLCTLHTSGTTAESMTFRKTARQLLGEAALWARSLSLSPGDTVLATVPAHHIYGLLFSVLLPLAAGAAFVRRTPLLPVDVSGLARRHGARLLVGVPAHLRPLLELPESALLPVRRILSSGAPLPPETGQGLVDRFGVEVIEILGSTETGGIARRRGDAGEPWQPLPGVHLEIGPDGNLVVRSPFVEDDARGQRTGDRVEILPDGRFRHLGRDDGVVKIAGTRLDLGELESRVLALPGVRDAAAVAVDVDGLRGVEAWLAVVAPSWTVRGIKSALAAHFEASVLPRKVRILPSLPRGEGGKIKRAVLRTLLEADPPESPPEPALAVEPVETRESDGKQIRVSRVTVPEGAVYFEGHFPGDPILPAVAQLSELLVPQVRLAWPDLGSLSGSPRMKFSALIRPRDVLRLTLVRRGRAARVDYALHSGEDVCASGSLVFASPE